MLHFPNGRRAAFEVTALAADGALQIDSLLKRDDYSWPSPGDWWWTIQVGSPCDLPRLKACYARIALLCESRRVDRPEIIWRMDRDLDPDLVWLIEESSSDMWGHPQVPAIEGDTRRDVMVVPEGRGGVVDLTLDGLRDVLVEEFSRPHMIKHLDKVARAEADEHHLFIPIHRTALPFAIYDALCAGCYLPLDAAPLPPGVTHLWLAPDYGRRVLLWTPGGWQQHYPYDN
ncbi:hypothetical protein [Streptomyces antimycoticus]|uniref:hypothetical protein n=1 Tax=Streptomyces antimycoticus TaxID=68175 RepID=UPI0025708090|nr:hypothetical protein [Streptomyces antimycoticus]WJD97680.1 hypothetical protein QR300_17710 [Streptomyces antimycoticus]